MMLGDEGILEGQGSLDDEYIATLQVQRRLGLPQVWHNTSGGAEVP